MDISVISVTYNSERCIADCVKSVLSQRGVEFEAVVVDNASTDNTLARLKELKCRVIANPENVGFGLGNNLGFAATSGRYVFLLNPDARLVETNALANLCRLMDANPRWGMAGNAGAFSGWKTRKSAGNHLSRPAPYPAGFLEIAGKNCLGVGRQHDYPARTLRKTGRL